MISYKSKPVNLDRQNTAHAFDTDGLLDESGDKIASFRNNGVEKAYIDKDGALVASSINGLDASHSVFAAGTFTTVGGDANESITAAGALATDLAFIMLRTPGATPRTVLSAAAATNAINVIFSGDPAADHVICWQLLRANS